MGQMKSQNSGDFRIPVEDKTIDDLKSLQTSQNNPDSNLKKWDFEVLITCSVFSSEKYFPIVRKKSASAQSEEEFEFSALDFNFNVLFGQRSYFQKT